MAHSKRDVTHGNIFAALNGTFNETFNGHCNNTNTKLYEQWTKLQTDVRPKTQNLIMYIYLFSRLKLWKIFFSLNVVVSTE